MSDGIKDAFNQMLDGITIKSASFDSNNKLISNTPWFDPSVVQSYTDQHLVSHNTPISHSAPETLLNNALGQVTAFSQGIKHDNGKPTTALLPSKPLLEIAKVLDFGAAKYEAHNWTKGIKYSRVLSAAQRHLMAWNDGEQVDPESKLTHLAHAACNILFLLEYELKNMTEFDDRRKDDNE